MSLSSLDFITNLEIWEAGELEAQAPPQIGGRSQSAEPQTRRLGERGTLQNRGHAQSREEAESRVGQGEVIGSYSTTGYHSPKDAPANERVRILGDGKWRYPIKEKEAVEKLQSQKDETFRLSVRTDEAKIESKKAEAEAKRAKAEKDKAEARRKDKQRDRQPPPGYIWGPDGKLIPDRTKQPKMDIYDTQRVDVLKDERKAVLDNPDLLKEEKEKELARIDKDLADLLSKYKQGAPETTTTPETSGDTATWTDKEGKEWQFDPKTGRKVEAGKPLTQKPPGADADKRLSPLKRAKQIRTLTPERQKQLIEIIQKIRDAPTSTREQKSWAERTLAHYNRPEAAPTKTTQPKAPSPSKTMPGLSEPSEPKKRKVGDVLAFADKYVQKNLEELDKQVGRPRRMMSSNLSEEDREKAVANLVRKVKSIGRHLRIADNFLADYLTRVFVDMPRQAIDKLLEAEI